jgi:hypothetical protein
MVNEQINWIRVIACGGLAFFTAIPVNVVTGSPDFLISSALMGFVTGGLAFFTELKLESYGVTGALQPIVSKSLIL